MITVENVILVDGRLENIGEWDYMPYDVPVVNNPFPGPMDAPEGWDFQVTYRTEYANPLPEGAVFAEMEVFYDRNGKAWLVEQAADIELESRLAAAKAELADLMEDLLTGLATDEEKARAAELRIFLKENPKTQATG